jgi:hypothetical protein
LLRACLGFWIELGAFAGSNQPKRVIFSQLSGFSAQSSISLIAVYVQLNNCCPAIVYAVKWQSANSPALYGAEAIEQWRSGMPRHRPTQQINVRLESAMVARLEARAKANRTSLSEEIRPMLAAGLDPEPPQSLSEFRGWFDRLRNALETIARKGGGNIEELWTIVRDLEVEFSQLYTSAETKLSKYVGEPEIRELLRGAPDVPDEIKAKK